MGETSPAFGVRTKSVRIPVEIIRKVSPKCSAQTKVLGCLRGLSSGLFRRNKNGIQEVVGSIPIISTNKARMASKLCGLFPCFYIQ